MHYRTAAGRICTDRLLNRADAVSEVLDRPPPSSARVIRRVFWRIDRRLHRSLIPSSLNTRPFGPDECRGGGGQGGFIPSPGLSRGLVNGVRKQKKQKKIGFPEFQKVRPPWASRKTSGQNNCTDIGFWIRIYCSLFSMFPRNLTVR